MKADFPGQDEPFVDDARRIRPIWFEKLIKYVEKLNPLSDIDFPHDDTKSDVVRHINPQAGTAYTFVLSDSGKYCRFTNGSAVAATVPPHSAVPFEAGTQIDVIQAGAGKLTIAAGVGVTINSLASYKALAGRYAGGTLIQTDTIDTWDLVGNLIA